jgi:hypothetical protein
VTTTGANAGRSGREPPLNQNAEPGLRASRRSAHSVLLQTASLIEATKRPLKTKLTAVSSLRPLFRRSRHCSGVAAADDDDLRGRVAIGHVLKTAPTGDL